jgi:hypothetical protein
MPLAIPPEQGSLFLRSRDGYSEFVFVGDTQRCSIEVSKNIGYFLVFERTAFDATGWAWFYIVWQKL